VYQIVYIELICDTRIEIMRLSK